MQFRILISLFIFFVTSSSSLALAGDFNNQSPGTSYSMELGADGLYHHQLVILDVPCSPSCNITFKVQSAIGSIVQTSGDYIFSHDTCGVSYPPTN